MHRPAFNKVRTFREAQKADANILEQRRMSFPAKEDEEDHLYPARIEKLSSGCNEKGVSLGNDEKKYNGTQHD